MLVFLLGFFVTTCSLSSSVDKDKGVLLTVESYEVEEKKVILEYKIENRSDDGYYYVGSKNSLEPSIIMQTPFFGVGVDGKALNVDFAMEECGLKSDRYNPLRIMMFFIPAKTSIYESFIINKDILESKLEGNKNTTGNMNFTFDRIETLKLSVYFLGADDEKFLIKLDTFLSERNLNKFFVESTENKFLIPSCYKYMVDSSFVLNDEIELK